MSMAYYGVLLNVGNLGGDFYLNLFLITIAGYPGKVSVLFLLDRIGRKKVYVAYMLLGGIMCIGTIYPVVQKHECKYFVGPLKNQTVTSFGKFALHESVFVQTFVIQLVVFGIRLQLLFLFKLNLIKTIWFPLVTTIYVPCLLRYCQKCLEVLQTREWGGCLAVGSHIICSSKKACMKTKVDIVCFTLNIVFLIDRKNDDCAAEKDEHGLRFCFAI